MMINILVYLFLVKLSCASLVSRRNRKRCPFTLCRRHRFVLWWLQPSRPKAHQTHPKWRFFKGKSVPRSKSMPSLSRWTLRRFRILRLNCYFVHHIIDTFPLCNGMHFSLLARFTNFPLLSMYCMFKRLCAF